MITIVDDAVGHPEQRVSETLNFYMSLTATKLEILRQWNI